MNQALLDLLPDLMPKAVAWASQQEARILRDGQPLGVNQMGMAHAVGVRSPHLVRVLHVPSLPIPEDQDLKAAGMATGLFAPGIVGMTFGYGIFICHGNETRRLLSHELRHVHQYEAAGSINNFLTVYLQQVLQHGYMNAPLEINARANEIEF